jgi:hypothetical protein
MVEQVLTTAIYLFIFFAPGTVVCSLVRYYIFLFTYALLNRNPFYTTVPWFLKLQKQQV